MKEKVLFWSPRILTILAILFIMMFSLDVFGGDQPLGKQLLGFLIHNIPALILTAILLVAWRWEVIGGVIFIIASIAGSIIFFTHSGKTGSIIVMVPFLIVGVLYILHHVLYSTGSDHGSRVN
jgi:hypothetical protein